MLVITIATVIHRLSLLISVKWSWVSLDFHRPHCQLLATALWGWRMSGLAIQGGGVKCCHLYSYLVVNTEDTRRASPLSTTTLCSVERRHYLKMLSREVSSGTMYPGEGGGDLHFIHWPCIRHWWLAGNHSDLYTLTELAKSGTQPICWDGPHMDSTMFQGSRGRGAQSKACRKK